MVGVSIATGYAMFLFTVEHNFEGAVQIPRSDHDRITAALTGSSCLPMPWWFEWVTFGVEYHHIHHMNPRVPGYRLKVRA